MDSLAEPAPPQLPAAAAGWLFDALDSLDQAASCETDGSVLEESMRICAPRVSAWQIEDCWRYEDWPQRAEVLPPGSPSVDVGIDLVARRADGAWIAIQAKSRRLDEHGRGAPVASGEMDKFLAAAADKDVWAERWLVTNGAVELAGWSEGKDTMGGAAALRVVNLTATLRAEADAWNSRHCEEVAAEVEVCPAQSRDEMQTEAVEAAVRILRDHADIDEPGIPRGEARGRVVLPCGTGKTRIAQRIIERLTYPGEVSVVLCPSIALVAQLRREFLAHNAAPMREMAVCSDQTAGGNGQGTLHLNAAKRAAARRDAEERTAGSDDATADRGHEGVDAIQGCLVTTDPDEIAGWVRDRKAEGNSERVSVIFGTYQSARRVSDGILAAEAGDAFKVLVCDEAHRTAGLRRKQRDKKLAERVSEFTLCHDRDAFPAAYRVYQTATPRIYSPEAQAQARSKADAGAGWLVRDMDDQQTFGVELYRRSYSDAVINGWLSDYRIIGMGVGGKEAMRVANDLVSEADRETAEAITEAETAGDDTKAKQLRRQASRLPTTGDYLKGMAFALAIGGGARDPDGERVPITSCIGFLNTILRSDTMSRVLQSEAVRDWVAREAGCRNGYRLEHLDASSSVAVREESKTRMAGTREPDSHSILNVGIFSEGTDAPNLSAVAFLEPRRSAIDVVQAVGRVMRKAPGKHLGYIVVPVVFPSGADAEEHLATSDMHEGWRELGEILRALRAHDQRIEDELPKMLRIQPPSAEQLRLELVEQPYLVSVGRPGGLRAQHAVVMGGSVEEVQELCHKSISEGKPIISYPKVRPLPDADTAGAAPPGPAEQAAQAEWVEMLNERCETHVGVSAREDGSQVNRADTASRYTAKQGEERGPINYRQARKTGRGLINGTEGRDIPSREERRQQREEAARRKAERETARQTASERHIQQQIDLLTGRLGGQITMNLLERSGLTANRTQRDLNLLRSAVEEAARLLRAETALAAKLDTHFGVDSLEANSPGKPRASGSTIAALLWMNAAMLQQRIVAGRWLSSPSLKPLAEIKTSPHPHRLFDRSWHAIIRKDFEPVLIPAVEALDAATSTDRLAGLGRALKHLAAEAEHIAAVYADMGVDHAGALFNKVMGDQASDGAFFTRPIAATICARLAFDAIDGDSRLDWSDPEVWKQHKTVDLACGSGTLLAAALSEMKARAKACGADSRQLAVLQKLAVEDTIKGLDINPISLQLAATQLMAGNKNIQYQRMGLHLMPYGPDRDEPGTVAAGSVELLGRSEIVNADHQFNPEHAAQQHMNLDTVSAKRLLTGYETDPLLSRTEMNDAVEAVANADVVIMNPPFTARIKMGEKYPKETREALRRRMDHLEAYLAVADPRLSEFLDKNSLGPRFAALASLCLNNDKGIFATIIPTTALTNTSGLAERLELARRFHVHTILTCHGAQDVNLSQETAISESIVVLCRHAGDRPDTRIISLDRLPADGDETGRLFRGLGSLNDTAGAISDGWGGVSYWPAERVTAGDWSACLWRSSELAEAAYRHANGESLRPLSDAGLSGHSTGRQLSNGYRRSTAGTPGVFPVLDSKGEAAQTFIEASPDEWWLWGGRGAAPILDKAGGLLISAGGQSDAARLLAVAAADGGYVGRGWRPVTGGTPEQSQALAVFINSTIGRVLLMRGVAKKLTFPVYNTKTVDSLPIPDIHDPAVVGPLAACWESTRGEVVPQFRDGYTPIRRVWDVAVCETLGWDLDEIVELGELLHREPRVCGVAYGQWK